jgi:hypothetical protein
MHYFDQQTIARDNQRRLREESRQHQLAQEAHEHSRYAPFYGPVLARTGAGMVRIGEILQNRYSETIELTAPVSDSCVEIAA